MDKKITLEKIKSNLKKADSDLYLLLGKSARGGGEHIIIANPKWHFLIGEDKFNVHLEGGPSRFALHFEVSPYTPHSKLDENIRIKNDKERDKLRDIFNNRIKIDGIEEDKARGNAVLTILNYEIDEEYNIDRFSKLVLALIDEITSVLEAEGYKLIGGEIVED